MKRFVTFFVALSATMLMGVTAHAATYGLEAAKATDGVVSVPVNVTTAANETTNINGYILKFEYDSNKVKPKVAAATDATGAECYATVDETFANGVMVSDIINGNDGINTLVVAWAGPQAVQVGGSAEVKKQLATVEFTVEDGVTDSSVPLTVTAATVAKDASSAPEAVPETSIASGSINLATVLKGDVDSNKQINTNDADMILKHYLGDIKLTETQMAAADMDSNSLINTNDADMVLKYYLNNGN